MARPVTGLAFFFIALSLFAAMLSATGVAQQIGLTDRVGGEESLEESKSAAKNVSTGAPTGQTLFGMYNVLTVQLASIFGVINPGLRMLYNAGVPAYIVGGPATVGLLPPLATFIKAIGTISFIRGWGL